MPENYQEYVIVKGDNLTKIAKQFDTTVDALVKLNNIENPNLIYAGATLKIPVAAAAAKSFCKEYVIVKGDNLTKIAKQFGTTVDALVKLNNIANPNLIYAGATLKIPMNEEEAKAAEAATKAAEIEKATLAAMAKVNEGLSSKKEAKPATASGAGLSKKDDDEKESLFEKIADKIKEAKKQ